MYLSISALSSLSVGSIIMVLTTGQLVVGAWKPGTEGLSWHGNLGQEGLVGVEKGEGDIRSY